jgi:hypothetical protein
MCLKRRNQKGSYLAGRYYKMGIIEDETGINLYMKPTQSSKELIEQIFSGLERAGGEYEERWGVSVPIYSDSYNKYKKYWNKTCPPNKAKEILSKANGSVSFHFVIANLSLDIRIQSRSFPGNRNFYGEKPIVIPLGLITLSAYSGNFNPGFEVRNYIMKGEDREREIEKKIDNANILVEAAKCVWNSLTLKPLYGIGGERGFVGAAEKRVINNELSFPCVDWVDFYGPELIEKIGRGRLLSAPAYKVEELTDGIVILTSPFPPLFIPDDYKHLDTSRKVGPYFGEILKSVSGWPDNIRG